jgi:hypothetical protein
MESAKISESRRNSARDENTSAQDVEVFLLYLYSGGNFDVPNKRRKRNRYRLVELSTSKSCRTGEIPRGAHSPAGTLQLDESHNEPSDNIWSHNIDRVCVDGYILGLYDEIGVVPREREKEASGIFLWGPGYTAGPMLQESGPRVASNSIGRRAGKAYKVSRLGTVS